MQIADEIALGAALCLVSDLPGEADEVVGHRRSVVSPPESGLERNGPLRREVFPDGIPPDGGHEADRGQPLGRLVREHALRLAESQDP